MRNTSRLADLIRHICNAKDVRQVELSAASGLSQAGIARLSNGNHRPEPDTLRRITHCWQDPHADLAVLCAHLRDEIERADHLQESVNVEPGDRPALAPTAIDRDLDTLREEAQHEPEIVASLLHDMAEMIRCGLQRERAAASALRIAETRPTYGTPRAHPTRGKPAPKSSNPRKSKNKNRQSDQ